MNEIMYLEFLWLQERTSQVIYYHQGYLSQFELVGMDCVVRNN